MPMSPRVLALARRAGALEFPKADWACADVARDDLVPLFRGADVVVHLAWLIQPSRDSQGLWRANVEGSIRLFRAVAEARVPALVYASSVGAYSKGPKDRSVDESWPTNGIPSSFYGRQKAEVERRLDRFEREHSRIRVVRLRPGLLFKREAASGIRRLFAGPFLVNPLLRPALLRVVPRVPDLRFQVVHTEDVAEAYRLAIVSEAQGPFNVAAEPVLDSAELSRILRARQIPISSAIARGLTAVSWKLHLQPTPPGWLDLALGVPILDTSRIRTQLGWSPKTQGGRRAAGTAGGDQGRRGTRDATADESTQQNRELLSGVGSTERP